MCLHNTAGLSLSITTLHTFKLASFILMDYFLQAEYRIRSTSGLEIHKVRYRETDYLLYLHSAVATASRYAMD